MSARPQIPSLWLSGPKPGDAPLFGDLGGPGDGTLHAAMQLQSFALPELLDMALQLAQALGRLHGQGASHLQVHPSHILLADTLPQAQQQALLLGSSLTVTLVQPRPDAAPHRESHGELAYLAPEQTGRTGRPVDQRADLYGLGATLYRLITGQPPFENADPLQLLHNVLAQRPLPPLALAPGVPQPLSDIVMRLLEKEPERRYQSAEGLAHDLLLLRQRLEAAKPGEAVAFELGGHDFAARLSAPARLIGRETELAALQAAFAQSARGSARAALIAGAPGVGKSTLINALRPLVSAQRGWFVSGKFDQYRQDRSTDAVHQVFRALGRLLLAEPEAELAPLRQRMLDALGSNAGIIAASQPEIALLLGVAPEPAGDDPVIASRRKVRAAADLICAIASPTRPLVVVLDDLQWAAPTPLAWLDTVLAEGRAKGLLLVCAYRESEIDAAHPLTAMQARWHGQTAAPLRLVLDNLGTDELAALVGDMLRLAAPEAAALTALLAPHCGGNPFDTVELVNALRDDGALKHGAGGWSWDAAAMRRHVARGGVIDLLHTRLRKLPLRSLRLLSLMACLGGEVQPALLQAAAGLAPGALDDHLAPALDDGLVLTGQAGDGAVRFRHDRVQQAAYACITAPSRRRLHLVLARRLDASAAFADFAAEQYLPALAALRGADERRRAARRFLTAAAGLRVINMPLAERLLAAGSSLLDAADGALQATVQIDHHAALYSLGRLDEADLAYRRIEAGATPLLQRIDPACVQISSLSNRGRQQEAAALGLRLLGELGFTAPAAMSAADVVRAHDELAAVADDDRHRASASLPAVLGAGKLMNRMMPALHRCDLVAMTGLVTEAMRLWVRHGPCAELVGPVAHTYHVLGATPADYRRGSETLRHVLTVSEARGFEPAASQARFLSGLAGHWFEPLEDTLPSLRRAREGLLHGGDLQNASFAYMPLMTALLDCAPTLGHFSADVEAALAFSERIGNRVASNTFTGLRHLVATLRAEPGAPDQLTQWFANVPTTDVLQNARGLAVCALAATLFGDTAAQREYTERAIAARHPHHFYGFAQVKLLSGLALAEQVRSGPAGSARLAEFDECRNWMAERAADAPANFGHLLAWLDAERAWATGDLWAATRGFETALREAAGRQRPWHAALITERAARFHLAHGVEHAGRALMTEARRRFDAWGASAKVHQLDEQYPFLQPHADEARRGGAAVCAGPADAIDMLAIVRASQALASETSLAQLQARVIELLGGMTGATSVRVLLWRDQQWHDPAAGGGALPLSVLRYVERTRAPLVVDDAVRDDRFAADPSLRGARSLLAVPILHQGELSALLLLENRSTYAAFAAERLDAVMLITGQLAVSLANVQLYESLEQRVQERTRELQQAQSQLLGAARLAGMAEIATNVLHNVGNVLNSVNVSADLVGAQLRDSKLPGLARALDLLDEHAADLGAFVTLDPRGKLLPGYLRQLAKTLQGERTTMAEELDVLVKSVGHIKDIVATQQSYAGSGRVVETLHFSELLDDALRMNAGALTRHKVEVTQQIDDMPALPLDRHRLLQILVNLISNAKHATAATPDRAACIRLGATLVTAAAGRVLRITVADNGEGIAPENLTRVFAHGFTTRKSGHGFGLHSCVLAAQEMGGTLGAHSPGCNQGASFVLEIPIDTPEQVRTQP